VTIKRFRTGTGRLDANDLNEMIQGTQSVQRLPAVGQEFRSRWYGPIACKIIDVTAGATGFGQWIYQVSEVTFSSNEDFAVMTGGFTSTHCINLAERGNTATVHSGITVSSLPGTFDLTYIPTGAVVAVYIASNGNATNPNTVWFDRPGEFDGACS
tara:strand:+ start:160 stop:627 length:468 start_codon:yes stop_codon:yes gene_type:complete